MKTKLPERLLWDQLLVGDIAACKTEEDVKLATISINTLYRLSGKEASLESSAAPCFLIFDGKRHQFVETLEEALSTKNHYSIKENDVVNIEDFEIQ